MLEVLFIIIAGVFWLVSSVNKQKQKQAEQQKREAAVRALQAAAAAKNAAAQAPHNVPAPSIRPTVAAPAPAPEQRRHTVTPSSVSGHTHMETSLTGISEACPSDAGAQPRPVSQHDVPLMSGRLAAYKAQKREAGVPAPASRLSAAAHASVHVAAAPAAEPHASATAANNAFVFDPARARDAVLYAEILSRPKALRRGRF